MLDRFRAASYVYTLKNYCVGQKAAQNVILWDRIQLWLVRTKWEQKWDTIFFYPFTVLLYNNFKVFCLFRFTLVPVFF